MEKKLVMNEASSEHSQISSVEDEDYWVDENADEESLEYKCLYGDKTFNDANTMLEHCASDHHVDFRHLLGSLSRLHYSLCSSQICLLTSLT